MNYAALIALRRRFGLRRFSCSGNLLRRFGALISLMFCGKSDF
jgi:hypothetical protein